MISERFESLAKFVQAVERKKKITEIPQMQIMAINYCNMLT